MNLKDIVPKPFVIVTIFYIILFVAAINYELKHNQKFRSTFVCEKNNTFSKFDDGNISLYFYKNETNKEETLKCNETLKKLAQSGQNLLYIEMAYILILTLSDWLYEKLKNKKQN